MNRYYASRKAAVLLSIALASLIMKPIPVHSGDGNNQGGVRVMTQNMFEGTNFQEFTPGQTLPEFLASVTATYQDILATRPAERAVAMAGEIAKKRPDLVALHEASLLRVGPLFPLGTPPSAATVKMDLVQSLLDELEKLGEHYFLVGAVIGADVEAPSTLAFDVRVTDRDAIIARSHIGMIALADPEVHHFTAMQTAQTPIGPIPSPAGWVSLDAIIRGQPLRFVSVHLPPDQTSESSRNRPMSSSESPATRNCRSYSGGLQRRQRPFGPTLFGLSSTHKRRIDRCLEARPSRLHLLSGFQPAQHHLEVELSG
jgi:hypothetical protein